MKNIPEENKTLFNPNRLIPVGTRFQITKEVIENTKESVKGRSGKLPWSTLEYIKFIEDLYPEFGTVIETYDIGYSLNFELDNKKGIIGAVSSMFPETCLEKMLRLPHEKHVMYLNEKEVKTDTKLPRRERYQPDTVTDWFGNVISTVPFFSYSKNNWGAERIDVWFKIEGDNHVWHGVNLGDNMVLRVKRNNATTF